MHTYVPAALLCLVSGVAFWLSLNWGMGLSPDSMFYLKQSMALEQGFSVSRLEDKAPPLYPMMQYVMGMFVGESFVAIKILHALLYVLNGFLFALLVFAITGGSGLSALLAVLVHALNPTVYTLHSYALTEPLFVTFLLLTLLFLHRHFATRTLHWLVFAGSAAGLMVLTRFAGVSFLASISMSLPILLRGTGTASLLKRLAAFVLPAVLLPLLWTLAKFVFDPAADSPRTLQFHPVSLEQLLAMFRVFGEWLYLGQSLPVFIALFIIVAHLSYARFTAGALALPAFLVFNACFYAAFILLSISFFDAYIPVDQRIMLPVLYLALLFVFEAAHRYLQASRRWPNRVEAGVLAALVLVFGGTATLAAGIETYREGRGFMSKTMQELEIHDVVRSSDAGAIYTNAPELVQLHVGKEAKLLPQIFDASSRIPNGNLVDELNTLLQAVDEGRAVIVHYNAVNWRTYLPSPEFFAEQYGLAPGYATPEGAIFRAPLLPTCSIRDIGPFLRAAVRLEGVRSRRSIG